MGAAGRFRHDTTSIGATIGKFFTRQNRRFRDGLLGVGFKRTAHNSHGVGEYISPVRYCEQRGSDETALNPMAYAALTAFLDSLPAFGGPVTRHSSWRPTACAFSRRRLCSGRRRIGDVSLAAGAWGVAGALPGICGEVCAVELNMPVAGINCRLHGRAGRRDLPSRQERSDGPKGRHDCADRSTRSPESG